MTRATPKPKRPPSFQHYPLNRAKKLKKVWVESAKIKSKWKAEKRKAGLPLSQPEHDAEENLSEQDVVEGPSSSEARPEKPEQPRIQLPVRIGKDRTEAQSVRELTKQAYSSSSLHTHKSKLRHSGKEGSRLESVKRRGQPDMKLRMNAMLAKIKQNYT